MRVLLYAINHAPEIISTGKYMGEKQGLDTRAGRGATAHSPQ